MESIIKVLRVLLEPDKSCNVFQEGLLRGAATEPENQSPVVAVTGPPSPSRPVRGAVLPVGGADVVKLKTLRWEMTLHYPGGVLVKQAGDQRDRGDRVREAERLTEATALSLRGREGTSPGRE